MITRRNIAFCSIVFSAVLALAACSSTTAKPESSSAAPAKPPTESQKQSPASGGGSISSLEALKRGELTATAAASPLKEVYFGFDQYDLRSDARDTLKANWEWLRANPAARVEIEGHADERGTTEYNLALGAKRAQSVKDYLVTLGTAADRLSTISYGEEAPVCREHNEECWQKNRRARFVIQPTRPAS